MSPLTFSLREAPDQRLDLSPLVPQNLAGKTVAEIERIELQTTRVRVAAGEVFRIREGDPDRILIEGGAERFDRVGMGMASGSIRVEGEVGVEAGRLMSGGHLTIRGDAGPFAGSRMKGGTLDIEGDAGDRLGGPLSGETVGMSGGLLHVRGDAGGRAGDRLRRGLMLIEGGAGPCAGSRMIAGTLAIGGEAGRPPRLFDGPRHHSARAGRNAYLADIRRLRRTRARRGAAPGRLYRSSERNTRKIAPRAAEASCRRPGCARQGGDFASARISERRAACAG